MGKPFKKELELLTDTYKWAIRQEVEEFARQIRNEPKVPLYIVGSGGSLSACYFAAALYQQSGMMAKAVTPLELIYSKESLKNAIVLFISASGKNTDILFAYKTAISYEPRQIYSLCMTLGSPLSKLAAKNSITRHFDFKIPAGKDGFLATNSLVAFFTLLCQAFSTDYSLPAEISNDEWFLDHLGGFLQNVSPDFTFTILHAGWGQPVAVDLESKLAEAALADVLLSDWRNFGHGRHHWFAKRLRSSAIIALITPEEEQLAAKTLALLPPDVPVLTIQSRLQGAAASIDLLVKSFSFIEQIGSIQGIDPGRPGVPEFGSKLYHLNYQKLYNRRKGNIPEIARLAITRKADIPAFEQLNEQDKEYWLRAFRDFSSRIGKAAFGSVVFDYDGTLCSASNRLTGIDTEIARHLNQLLEHGIIIGIATGRGQSARSDLQKIIPERHYHQVVIGYYNCSDFGTLGEDHIPDKKLPQNLKLKLIHDQLNSHDFLVKVAAELKPHQIIIQMENKEDWKKVRLSVIQFIISLNISDIQILESSHSMDIIDQSETNKLNIINYCREKAVARGLPVDCLCIGDKGKWPGNDYQLLSSMFSLSVDEVSEVHDSCWNLAKCGQKNTDATKYYLSCLNYSQNGLTLKIV